MNPALLGLCGLVLLGVWLLRDAITDMCKEEFRTRLGKLPYALLRVIVLRIPRPERLDVLGEWCAEMDFILSETDGLPVTRLLRGIRYSLSLLSLMVPFARLRDRLAAYFWRRESRQLRSRLASQPSDDPATASIGWVREYLRIAVALDGVAALAAGALAYQAAFGVNADRADAYLAISLSLPLIWILSVRLAGGYNVREIGIGSEEFRRIMTAGLSLAGSAALVAWATGTGLSRVYVLIALPTVTVVDLVVRYRLRKRLRSLRESGLYMRRVTAVGHAGAVAELIVQLRRDRYHGLEVVNACVADYSGLTEIEGVPVTGGFSDAARVAGDSGTDMVAVLACPEMDGVTLRRLAWELEKTDTDLCVAPALMDVAGPRTTIRPVAGLPLLQVDHAELTRVKRAVKNSFDKLIAATALFVTSPLFIFIAIAIRHHDGGPVLFGQTRVGKDGQPFRVLKFRTMVPDAELRKEELSALDEGDGLLFKVRRDPRITAPGAWLRRWSLDELPQLFNVVLGEMSLVGPRPPLPAEAARFSDDVYRRLVVRPGLTGLWQVNGRSDLSREDAVRLDLRYVENWSLALDLQILWKTISVLAH